MQVCSSRAKVANNFLDDYGIGKRFNFLTLVYLVYKNFNKI